jgi:hypothetical protein
MPQLRMREVRAAQAFLTPVSDLGGARKRENAKSLPQLPRSSTAAFPVFSF